MTKKYLALISFFLPALFLVGCSSSPVTDAGPRPYLGGESAPVLIEEFSDLQCPACGLISPQVERFVKDNPTVAKMVYYHFPLPQHEYAFAAAEASECAADQGKFWDYVSLAFENQENLSSPTLYSIAEKLALDAGAFKTCLEDHERKGKVLSDFAEGRRRRVSATPTFYVNGQPLRFSGIEPFGEYIKGLAATAN